LGGWITILWAYREEEGAIRHSDIKQEEEERGGERWREEESGGGRSSSIKDI